MTHDSRTDLEADIAKERNALADSLSELTSAFSPERLVSSVGDTLKNQSDHLAETVVTGARENPAAVALVGAGLAWLLLGKKDEKTPAQAAYDPTGRPTVGGFNPDADTSDFKARVAAAEAAMHGHTARTQSGIEQAKSYVQSSAAQMRATLYDGTSQLSDAARARVVQAREKAMLLQEEAERRVAQGAQSGRSFYDKNPLLVGAGIAAVGALVAASLPRTRTEDAAFGAQRDALMAEADRALQEELSRAKLMAEGAFEEATRIARDAVADIPAGEEAVDMAEAKVRAMGERVADGAHRAAKTH
ncbi:DUF3618 domain-containing protein [Jannaschia sp. M317]|uniref:DUF3618 domain-containing protein n=1 Tax=Jannaschia sp. M317 TaxID=2867011 RepID=UPI0021A85406|nr:DUF3618 domain-containing protein [Jannaschia sp. M317]UWQ18056.1 DUF3618 domain-containing protein [Jannaschia sp. M317]